ncbi:quinone oxidoreductase family protein [Derxia gummosa]|uniref:Quinone oxidoreductase family protein n=1 Tax=Derxia gummosa DSM 723 TaxID=1121388 RepID=A0A8B6X3X4_9BURK|nr:zinc-binding dehydrogenase [Derxia gummosa]
MKAIQLDRFGGTDQFRVVELPAPEPGPGQIRVRVHAAGVNFAETLMRENRYAMTPALPWLPGCEAAGTIDALGAGVTRLAVGQRVAAPLFAAGVFAGGYASEVVIDAALALPLPDGLGWDDAVALQVQGLTALALARHVPVAGRSALVSAAAGGVGGLLVQLLREAGAATVTALAGGPAKCALATSLGADAAIDYRAPDWIERVRAAAGGFGPDVIHDSVGGDFTPAALGLLAPRGNLVVYGALNIQRFAFGVPELLALIFRNQSVTGFALAPLLTPERLHADWRELCALHAQGRLRTVIGARLPLEQAGEAHRLLESRASTGKLVLHP